jgi:ADP-ribose pyrophosphatase
MTTDNLTEKRLSSNQIYKGRIVTLSVDTVELPNGKTSKRELIQHPGAVAMVPVDPQGRIIMVRQFRYAANKILLELPAGTLNPTEPPELCAARELQEETGYKAEKLELLGGVYVAPGSSTEFIHIYLATGLTESRLEMDDDEFIEVETYPLDVLLQQVYKGEIQDGKTVTGLMLASRQLGR